MTQIANSTTAPVSATALLYLSQAAPARRPTPRLRRR